MMFRFWVIICLACLSCGSPSRSVETRPLNVLFIAVDDLRPQLNCYGNPQMITPNMDALAQSGRLFQRHFVQVPTCGASRCALLTGRRPRGRPFLNNQIMRDLFTPTETEQPESFVHQLKRNGYYTAGLGKISHYPDGKIYTYEGEGDGRWEMPLSWNEMWGPVDKWETAWNAFFAYADGSNRNREKGNYPPVENGPDSLYYPDHLIAAKAIDALQRLKDTTFFLGVGFFKPHLPFTAPQKYWDLYHPDSIKLSPNPLAPAGISAGSLHRSGEMFGNYYHAENGGAGIQISDSAARRLVHGYYACVSFVDDLVGQVLAELERLELAENTLVVLWGDHGWHLGDHTIWGKHSTFERALHSSLIIRTPNMNLPGIASHGLVETVDLYPTLMDYCQISLPDSLDGVSLRPMLENPEERVKEVAYGFWRNRKTLRTDRYRVVNYDDNALQKVEVFDHQLDPWETTNVAWQDSVLTRKLLGAMKGIAAE